MIIHQNDLFCKLWEGFEIHQNDYSPLWFYFPLPWKKQQLPSTLCSIWTQTQLQWRAHLDRVALFHVEKVQCFTFIWKNIKFQKCVFGFQTLHFQRVWAQWTHFASLRRVWRWREQFGYHFPTFELGRVFMKKINVDFYSAVSVFRTSEIWSTRVHWSHPARLGWTRRLQNKIWV